MFLIPRVLQFIWAHRTVALIVAACWNVLAYFLWGAESIPNSPPTWLPVLFAFVFALLFPVSLLADRRRKETVERASGAPGEE
jgi:hypothetical protein